MPVAAKTAFSPHQHLLEPDIAYIQEATIAERCRRLDAETIKPHTKFHGWPKPKKPN